MTWLHVSASIVAVSTFAGASLDRAGAMPMQPLAYATSVVSVACQRGGPNCLPVDPSAPTKCGAVNNPCVIDGGPDCLNASSCGTDNTGNHNLNGASNMPGVIGARKPQQPVHAKPVVANGKTKHL